MVPLQAASHPHCGCSVARCRLSQRSTHSYCIPLSCNSAHLLVRVARVVVAECPHEDHGDKALRTESAGTPRRVRHRTGRLGAIEAVSVEDALFAGSGDSQGLPAKLTVRKMTIMKLLKMLNQWIWCSKKL